MAVPRPLDQGIKGCVGSIVLSTVHLLVADQRAAAQTSAAYPARFALSEADIANAPEVPPAFR